MRIRGLLNRLIPLGYEVLPSADESSKDEQIQVPISHLSSLFSSLQPSISSDVDLAFYDSELLTREVISQVHLQRSKFGINSSTPTEVGVESLGFVDLPSLIDFVLRLQHESLRLLSALSQSSNEIIEEESLALRQLYEARGDVDDDDKGKLKARAETPLLPSHLIELFDPIGIQDYASQHGLCYPSEVFQITGSDGTEKRIVSRLNRWHFFHDETDLPTSSFLLKLALHSLLRILAFCPHLEALWILSEPETPNQNSVTTVTIAKKAAKIWETLRSKSLLLPKVKDEPQKGAESNSSKNSFADCKPLERLTLSSVSSTSSEILALIDSYFESDGVENVDSEASNISDTRTTATLAVVVIDSVDSFFKKEELNGKASIVELGVGLVARARKSGMRVYVSHLTFK